MKSKEQVGAIIAALKTLYPDALCSLDYEKDYELLFSVRLAAQCTDARVNLVTPALFARYPTLEAFAAADVDEVGTYIQSCGFWAGQGPGHRWLRENAGGALRRKGPGQHGGPALTARCGAQDRQSYPGRYLRKGRLCLRYPLASASPGGWD